MNFYSKKVEASLDKNTYGSVKVRFHVELKDSKLIIVRNFTISLKMFQTNLQLWHYFLA